MHTYRRRDYSASNARQLIIILMMVLYGFGGMGFFGAGVKHAVDGLTTGLLNAITWFFMALWNHFGSKKFPLPGMLR